MTLGWLLSQTIAVSERLGGPRTWSLVLGVIMFITGVFLLFNHKLYLNQILESSDDPRELRFELRKFRRRSLVGSMIASVGCMIGALHWVTDARIFSIFILLILGLLMAILVVACFDLFSVSLQAATRTDSKENRQKVEAFLEQRRNEHRREGGSDESDKTDLTGK